MAGPTESETARPPEALTTVEIMAGGGELAMPPRVRGESLMRPLENAFLRLDRLLARFLPESLNPFLHTGAVAVTSFLVANITGIALLLWYSPSVHLAFESVAAMSAAPFTSGLVRSLHRYSSDACMFFGLVHALRFFLGRRFAGAQWLAWVTGFAMIAILWFIGWTGYWLVWDERAQYIAIGTARALDVMPIFVDPMERAFLTDEGVNSLLFFVVFFFHMLIPLAMGLVLWLHIARLARARFLTRKPMTIWVLASLLLLSIAYPADNAGPASMATLPQAFTMDWWYLAPMAFTDRLGGGALWSLVLVGGAVGFGIPWSLGRPRPKPATVMEQRCNACTKCYQDCPYDAITMVPRSDGNKRHDVRASVDPSKCVSSGICAGSCDTAGIGVDWFSVSDQRRRFAGWLKRAAVAGESPLVAFICGEGAGASLTTDPETGRCHELPGYLVIQVPCAGWIHPFGIEHTIRYGGEGVLVASCGPGACRYREGASWEQLRLDGLREPVLRTQNVPRDKVLLLSLDRTQKHELLRQARAFREGQPAPSARTHSPSTLGLAAAVLAAVIAAGLGLVSDLVYAAPRIEGSELVVSFKHPGQVAENCRDFTPEELAQRPVHMRQERVCDRSRADVRLRVSVDGRRAVDATLPPKGIWGDGNSVAIERIPIELGEHEVRVELGDTADPDEWSFTDDRKLTFDAKNRRVVTFDRISGFAWH
jgi:ferredoxin/coenzyme F420-reducing hydrogenase delta subunit